MATVKTVLVKGRSNRSGKFPLVVQVLHKRRKKVVYTGFSIPDNLFDPVRGRVIVGGEHTPESVRRINHRCESISKLLVKSISIMEKKSREYEIEDVFRTYGVLTREAGFILTFHGKSWNFVKAVTRERPGHMPPACVRCRDTWGKRIFPLSSSLPGS